MCVCVLYSSDMMEDEEDDTIHMGNAIMTFYAALIDLLGRCAPEMHVSLKHTHTERKKLVIHKTCCIGLICIL